MHELLVAMEGSLHDRCWFRRRFENRTTRELAGNSYREHIGFLICDIFQNKFNHCTIKTNGKMFSKVLAKTQQVASRRGNAILNAGANEIVIASGQGFRSQRRFSSQSKSVGSTSWKMAFGVGMAAFGASYIFTQNGSFFLIICSSQIQMTIVNFCTPKLNLHLKNLPNLL